MWSLLLACIPRGREGLPAERPSCLISRGPLSNPPVPSPPSRAGRQEQAAQAWLRQSARWQNVCLTRLKRGSLPLSRTLSDRMKTPTAILCYKSLSFATGWRGHSPTPILFPPLGLK